MLLREVLRETGRAGIGRVVIRTREYLSMVVPEGDALMLILMRFPQELVDVSEYRIPEGDAKDFGISAKELQMARTLLESMASDFDPTQYKDEFRERLHAVIKRRISEKGATTTIEEEEDEGEAATNVVDFMALLQQSLKKKGGSGTTDDTPPARKKPARKTAAKKTRARRQA